MWLQHQNKKLADKRRDEELRHTIKEWSDAKARMEVEIQRKNEHRNFGTNFEKARGFVRSNWKTKNFDPTKNPLVLDSSTDSEDYEEEHHDEIETNQIQEINEDLDEEAEGDDGTEE